MPRRRRSIRHSNARRAFAVISIGVVLLAAILLSDRFRFGRSIIDIVTGGGGEIECCDYRTVLADHNMALTAFLIRDIWEDGRPGRYRLPNRFETPAQAVYVGLLSDGKLQADMWATAGTVLDALESAIGRAQDKLTTAEREQVDTIILFLGHSFERVSRRDYDREIFANRHRGTRGIQVLYKEKAFVLDPFKAIMENRSNRSIVDEVAENEKVEKEKFLAEARLRVFEGEQIVVRLGFRPRAALLERGNRYVALGEVDQRSVRAAARHATDWLTNNLSREGRLNYGYLPAKGRPSRYNNMIRQWMATVALNRAAKVSHDAALWDQVRLNTEYNLKNYFHRQGELGLIYNDSDTVKLGAISVSGLALLENYHGPKYEANERALGRTVDSLWRPDGEFRTFLRPRLRNDNQNFYPGEALLYWASVYARNPSPDLLRRFMISFQYYRTWHLDARNRNPAFVPWHTQAYYIMWTLTKDPNLRQAIFEMNDWLLRIQQWDTSENYRDFLGRFYAPGGRFGPPHASATGVYLEGLIDAFKLAREVGDRDRADRYRRAILGGLRSAMQLQFVDDIDMFYVSKRKQKLVRGGIRTTVYNSYIRCDNVQHNLMAMLKILEAFRPEDYAFDTAAAAR